MDIRISVEKLSDLSARTQSLMDREFLSAHDAIRQVLNGGGFGKTENERTRRYAYERELKKLFPQKKTA